MNLVAHISISALMREGISIESILKASGDLHQSASEVPSNSSDYLWTHRRVISSSSGPTSRVLMLTLS